jgi:hypothetical protein
MEKRPYRVKAKVDGLHAKRLIVAGSLAEVARFLVNELFEIDTPTALEVATMISDERIKPEIANPEPTPEKPS